MSFILHLFIHNNLYSIILAQWLVTCGQSPKISQDTEAIALAYYQLLSKAAITVDLLLYKLSINLPCKLIIAI